MKEQEKVTRFELIDPFGRTHIYYFNEGEFEIQLQDEGRTCKVFLQYDKFSDIENYISRSIQQHQTPDVTKFMEIFKSSDKETKEKCLQMVKYHVNMLYSQEKGYLTGTNVIWEELEKLMTVNI